MLQNKNAAKYLKPVTVLAVVLLGAGLAIGTGDLGETVDIDQAGQPLLLTETESRTAAGPVEDANGTIDDLCRPNC